MKLHREIHPCFHLKLARRSRSKSRHPRAESMDNRNSHLVRPCPRSLLCKNTGNLIHRSRVIVEMRCVYECAIRAPRSASECGTLPRDGKLEDSVIGRCAPRIERGSGRVTDTCQLGIIKGCRQQMPQKGLGTRVDDVSCRGYLADLSDNWLS